MGRTRSPAEEWMLKILANGVTPPLKDAGFRKTGTNYHRRRGQTVQVVNVQLSHGSTWDEKIFYVNAGIAFDAICELAELPVSERPKEFECDRRGTRARLEDLVEGAPDTWTIREGVAVAEISVTLRELITRLRAELDRIDGLAAYRSHPWFDRFRPSGVNAQILFLLEDRDAARQEVLDLATHFQDRQNANRAEWWVEKLRLNGLFPH
jgi:hypothetical protein